MDKETKINDFKEKIKEFCEARDWNQFHDAKELSIGLMLEASELLEHFRWKSKDEVEEVMKNLDKKKNIEEEMADIMYYLIRIAQVYDIDLSDALNRKIEINEKNYPIEKFKGSNKKYNEIK